MLRLPLRSSLHSHPEGHFHILPSPDLHLAVVGSDVLKVGLGDGEEATSKCRGSGEAGRGACTMRSNEGREAQTQVKTGPVSQGDIIGVRRSGGFPGPALVSLMPQLHSRKNYS